MKRLASILCSGLLVVWAASAFAVSTSNVAEPIQKGDTRQLPGGWTDTGGETIATATVISALPYTDTDNTCGHTREYLTGPSCGSVNAPDLFYRYVPTTNLSQVTVSLCGSTYDTVVFVLENGVEIACNDDNFAACGGLQSEVTVSMVAGRTYIIGVTGYSSNCGPYILNLRTPIANCIPVCPPGVFVENEPLCGPEYIDNFNGGCNSTPNVFQDITCGTICGETGTYLLGGLEYRDTDWFRISVGPGAFSFSGKGDGYDLQLLVIDPAGGCANPVFLGQATTPSCVESTPITFTGPRTVWLWAGPSGFTGVPCGSKYIVNLVGPGVPPCGATAVEPATWGTIKNVYR